MSDIAHWAVELTVCPVHGPASDLSRRCPDCDRPLWTEEFVSRRQHQGAVGSIREAAELLEDIGTDEYVNPPTAEAMQQVAAELRSLLGGQ